MGMYWSKSKLGFFCHEIHGDSMPHDAVAISDSEYRQVIEDQAQGMIISCSNSEMPNTVSPLDLPISFDEVKVRFTGLVQREIDSLAALWGYDSVLSAATYSASSIPRFKQEALALLAYRDAMWAWANTFTDPGVMTVREFSERIGAIMAPAPAKPNRPGE